MDEKAATFEADLYKLRHTPAPEPSTFAGFPRWLVVLFVIWVALLETADKLPRLLLSFPGYEATLAEYQAKMMQPDITAAQLERARGVSGCRGGKAFGFFREAWGGNVGGRGLRPGAHGHERGDSQSEKGGADHRGLRLQFRVASGAAACRSRRREGARS